MRKNAQNLIEISLALLISVIVGVFLIGLYNAQKVKVAALSKPTVVSNSVNLNGNNYNPTDIVPYNPTETAGSSALTMLDPNMTLEQYNALMSNITNENLKSALDVSGTDNDLQGLGNKLIADLKLPIEELSADSVGLNTLSTLTTILNAIAANNLGQDPTAQAYMQRLKSLLDSVVLPTN